MIDKAIRGLIDEAQPITIDEITHRATQTSATSSKQSMRLWMPQAITAFALIGIVVFGAWQFFDARGQRVETAPAAEVSNPDEPKARVAPAGPEPAPSTPPVEAPTASEGSIQFARPVHDPNDQLVPFFSFRGTTDPLESAKLFLDAQFPTWSDVQLTVDEAHDRAARIRWDDAVSGHGGWVLLDLSDGAFMVTHLSTDGFSISLTQANAGARGWAASKWPRTIELFDAFPDPVFGPAGRAGDPTVALATFAIPGYDTSEALTAIEIPPSSQDLRVYLFDESGAAAGIAIATVGQNVPTSNETFDSVAVVSEVDQIAGLEALIQNNPQFVSDYLIRDPWPSADFISAVPEFSDLPLPAVDEVPRHYLTEIALNRPSDDATGINEFLSNVATWGYLAEAPASGLATNPASIDGPSLEDVPRYVVEEVPPATRCAMLGITGPEQGSGIADATQIFERPDDAAESAPVTVPKAELGLLRTEFVSAADVVLGYGWHYSGQPRTYLAVVHVEQTDAGWIATDWQTVGC